MPDSAATCATLHSRERLQVVSAFEHRDHPAARVAAGDRRQFAGEPGVVVGLQLQLRERVAPVPVEAGGDDHQLRAEVVERGQQAFAPRRAEAIAARPRRQRRIEDVAVAALFDVARVGIQRRLVRAQVQHARVVFEDRLRAVAVVHVEIDDRHALQLAVLDRVRGGDGRAVEQAEAHRHVAGRVVARRTHRAERALRIAVQHRIGGGHRGAGRAQRGFGGRGRKHGVGIQVHARMSGCVSSTVDSNSAYARATTGHAWHAVLHANRAWEMRRAARRARRAGVRGVRHGPGRCRAPGTPGAVHACITCGARVSRGLRRAANRAPARARARTAGRTGD